jgi:hypothetical protein
VPGGLPAPGGKDVTITAMPSSMQVTRGQVGQFRLRVAQTGASDPVSLSCSNMPVGVTCSFAPGTLTPGSKPMPVTLTIATSGMTAALHHNGRARLFALWLPGAMGLVLLPGLRRRYRRAALLGMVLGLALLQLACGGGTTTALQSPASSTTATARATSGTYTITVTATSGAVSRSTQLSVTVN